MGLGYAVYEHNVNQGRKILNPNFRDYRLPTALDMPKMRTFYDFTPDEEGPLGAKEAGEGSAAPVAPAIANAVNMQPACTSQSCLWTRNISGERCTA